MAKFPQGTGIFFIDVELDANTNKFRLLESYGDIVEAIKQGALPVIRWIVGEDLTGNLFYLKDITHDGLLKFEGRTINPDNTLTMG